MKSKYDALFCFFGGARPKKEHLFQNTGFQNQELFQNKGFQNQFTVQHLDYDYIGGTYNKCWPINFLDYGASTKFIGRWENKKPIG